MLLNASSLDPKERIALMNQITRDESGLLFGIAMSAAIWSVRESAAGRLSFGLLALILENRREDWRETLMHLCVLNHSANKLGVDLSRTYLEVRKLATPETAALMDAYFQSGERDLAAMGYIEFEDGDGFGYRRIL
jgi:hypothetical protein